MSTSHDSRLYEPRKRGRTKKRDEFRSRERRMNPASGRWVGRVRALCHQLPAQTWRSDNLTGNRLGRECGATQWLAL